MTKSFSTKTAAESWARDLETQLDRGYALPTREALRTTVADAIDTWIYERLEHMAESDRQNISAMLTWWKAELGRVALIRVDPAMIEKSVRKLREERDKDGQRVRTDARCNRYTSTMSRVLGYAVRVKRWISANPCTGVRRLKESPGRVRFLTAEEAKTLLDAVDARGKPSFSLFVRLGLATGARRGEIERLRWKDIDLVHHRITFNATKTNENRTVPLPAVLVPLIKEFGKVRPIDGEARLFPHPFYYDWREVQGVLPDFIFHSLRHSVASHLAMSGASLLDIAAVTGHKTLAMVKRYSHLSDEHVRSKLEEAASKLLK
ncbi:MAG: site-specific integrase [Burkholderiales bacterium]|nr:site-specific integrase [Burkholderiales bacterium]